MAHLEDLAFVRVCQVLVLDTHLQYINKAANNKPWSALTICLARNIFRYRSGSSLAPPNMPTSWNTNFSPVLLYE